MAGGGSKTPSKTTQTQDLPEWARGYAKDVLAKGAALTDINNNPYVKYGGERLAGFSGLQNQSFDSAQNMRVAPQIGLGSVYAAQSGQYRPVGQDYTGSNVSQYMNPFLQGALAPQLRAARDAGSAAQMQNAAKAVGMGAFGGTRGALQKSLTEQNTMQNMADINAKGYFDAFNNAQNQFNTQQGRNIQEAQYGNSAQQQAAQLLGQLGGQQFQQGMDISKLQNLYGAQQQQQQQKAADIGYQDFMDQQNYAYKQLGFMSDLIKNPAIGSRNQTLMYESPTSPLNTMAGLGLAAAGAGSANGGIVGYAGGGIAGYADGGMPGDIGEILSKLSDEQLQQAMQMHPEMAQEIQMEIARREDIRSAASMPPMEQGLGSAPAGPMPQMAGGGIVAFAQDGLVDLEAAKKKLIAAARSGDPAAIAAYSQMVSEAQSQIPPEQPTQKFPQIPERSGAGIGSSIYDAFKPYLPTLRRTGDPRTEAWLAEQERQRAESKPLTFEAGLPAAAAAVDQSKLKGAPQPAPDNKQPAPDGGPSSVSASSSSRGLGYAKMDMPDLSYTAKTPEEIETQLAAISQRKMAGNKGILDAEAADVKEEADALLKAKGGDQKRLLFSMAAAAFGSKAQGLDLGGIMTAGLKTDAEQRKLNTEAERALRRSRSDMRKFEQAVRAGEDDKAAKLYGLAQTEAGKAHQAKIDQMELALKQKGLDISAAQLRTQQAAASRPPAMVELLTKLGDGDIKKGLELYNADRSKGISLREKQLVGAALKDVEANFAKNNMRLAADPVAYKRALLEAKAERLRTIGYEDMANQLGFAGGEGLGDLGPLVQ